MGEALPWSLQWNSRAEEAYPALDSTLGTQSHTRQHIDGLSILWQRRDLPLGLGSGVSSSLSARPRALLPASTSPSQWKLRYQRTRVLCQALGHILCSQEFSFFLPRTLRGRQHLQSFHDPMYLGLVPCIHDSMNAGVPAFRNSFTATRTPSGAIFGIRRWRWGQKRS